MREKWRIVGRNIKTFFWETEKERIRDTDRDLEIQSRKKEREKRLREEYTERTQTKEK